MKMKFITILIYFSISSSDTSNFVSYKEFSSLKNEVQVNIPFVTFLTIPLFNTTYFKITKVIQHFFL